MQDSLSGDPSVAWPARLRRAMAPTASERLEA